MWVASFGGVGLRPADQIMQLEPIDNQKTQAARMEPPGDRRSSPRRLAVMLIVVVLAAAIVSGFLGRLAGFGYAFQIYMGPTRVRGVDHTLFMEDLGQWVGAALGIMVGLAWCRQMIRRAIQGGLSRPAATGAWLGLRAGWAATAVLHAVLSLARGKGDIGLVIIGIICASIAGPALGSTVSRLVPWACRKPDIAAEPG